MLAHQSKFECFCTTHHRRMEPRTQSSAFQCNAVQLLACTKPRQWLDCSLRWKPNWRRKNRNDAPGKQRQWSCKKQLTPLAFHRLDCLWIPSNVSIHCVLPKMPQWFRIVASVHSFWNAIEIEKRKTILMFCVGWGIEREMIFNCTKSRLIILNFHSLVESVAGGNNWSLSKCNP